MKLAAERAIVSAHDVSDGGLAVTLAESCFASATADGKYLSAEIELAGDAAGQSIESILFGERGSRAVVSLSPAMLARVAAIAAQYSIQTKQFGTVGRGSFRIQHKGVPVIQGSVDSFRQSWSESLRKALESAS